MEYPEIRLLIGKPLIPRATRLIDKKLSRPMLAAPDAVARVIRELYKENIVSVGAVATGRFVRSVRIRKTGRPGERIVQAERKVGKWYLANIIEFGWTERPRGQESYPGRYPAAITKAGATRAIDEALHHQLARPVDLEGYSSDI